MYDNALAGEKVTMIHFFGVKYAEHIKKSSATFADIAVAAGLGAPYGTEIGKGVKLSKYVRIK